MPTQEIFLSTEIADNRSIRSVLVPSTVAFRQIIVTGPPCSGKSTLVGKLGGWPEEGYVDLAMNNWWRSRIFTFRPREIHFGFPFFGFQDSHAIFDREWLQAPSNIDFSRVHLPPRKHGIFSINWRDRYAFDFQLLPAPQIYSICQNRLKHGTHPIDIELTPDRVQRAVEVYARLALYFRDNGMQVYFRDRFDGSPRAIVAVDSSA